MSSLNKVQLIGRLGNDPEVRMTPSGQQVASISVATSESWTKDGKKEERTEWHRLVLWGKLAELAQKYLKKGSLTYFEGKLQTSSWDDPQGQKRYKTEIIVHTMTFLSSGSSGGAPQQGAGAGGQYPQQDALPGGYSNGGDIPRDEDVPF